VRLDMIEHSGQTKTITKKKNKRKTFWSSVKSAATIKFLVKEKDIEKAKPTFIPSLEEKDERSIQMYADKIGSIIATMCENNPSTAARVLTKVLKSDAYPIVKVLFEDQYMSVTKEIVSGFKSFVKDHSNLPEGGTCRTAEQNAIDAVMLATVWNIDSSKRMGRELSREIDVRPETINEYIRLASEMKERGERFKPKKRKMRKDNVQEASFTYIQKWQHNDLNTRIDTNTWKEYKSMNPFTNEEQHCSRRIWSVVGAERNFNLFLDSPEYAEFKSLTNGTIGLTTFPKYLCRCTKEPTQESCVDPLISEVQHLMTAVKDGLTKLTEAEKRIISQLPGYNDLLSALKKGRAVAMVEASCCSRKEQNEFRINENHPLPKLLPFNCGNGTCRSCRFQSRFGEIFKHPIVTGSSLILKVYAWEYAEQQGKTKSGKKNTQLELTEKEMMLSEITSLFQKRFEECLPHIYKIEWMNAIRSFDVYNVGPSNIVIMTKFSATLNLKAIQTTNSSVDAHAFLDNFVVISNCRDASVRTVTRSGVEEVKVLPVNDCDVLQYFGSTMSKGKKNDYVTHNACLQAIIQRYKVEFEERGQKLTFVIIWTDNCPNQYKCKENFVGIFKIEACFGVLVAHCFAVKDNFKGVWDGAGKVMKNFLWRLEQQKTRTATAFDCFVNTKNEEFEFDDRQIWKRYEETSDPYLLQKNTFTYIRRIVGLVVDTEAEYNSYSSLYPGCIVYADRREVLTLARAVRDTTK
jgi:hypothetical protein